MTILSVGCALKAPQNNLVKLGISVVNPDVVWDLEKIPYPFDDSIFSEIECLDVIEHLGNIPNALEEFHRILKRDGVLKITTPHFYCANSYIGQTHEWHLSYFCFDYFSDGHCLSYYSKARYKIISRYIQFQGDRINRSIISRLANKYPINYEQRWAWIFPAWYLYFELETIK
ncbi:MAG: methyltransferase domain-containing protein [Nostoc sp.]|uniref:methyltransferase domain-containing protein n=1 Tax=Nostoc sp. TaxID=1180 RepID=UPI002FF45DC0